MSDKKDDAKTFEFGNGASIAIREWSQSLISKEMAKFRRVANPRPSVPQIKKQIEQSDGSGGMEMIDVLEDNPRDPAHQSAMKRYSRNNDNFRAVAAICAGIELTDAQREEVEEAKDFGFDPADYFGVDCYAFDEAFYVYLQIDPNSDELQGLIEATGAEMQEDLGRVAEMMDSFRNGSIEPAGSYRRIPTDSGSAGRGKRAKKSKD